MQGETCPTPRLSCRGPRGGSKRGYRHFRERSSALEVAPKTINCGELHIGMFSIAQTPAVLLPLLGEKMEMNWSRWFRCESSFELLLVPSQPGVFALAEEVAQAAGPQSRRMLAVFEVQEADDLSRAMSRLFAAGSPWREKLAQTHCFVRYAVAP